MADNFHRIKIYAPVTGYGTTIEIDGVPVRGVTEVKFSVSVDRPAEVTIKILGDLEIEGDVKTCLERV